MANCPSGQFLAAKHNPVDPSQSFIVYLPPLYERAKLWPVILFLHGSGERGSDGQAQTTVGLGPWLRKFPERYPAIVVFPQCPPEHDWLHPPVQAAALAALEDTIEIHRGDRQRLYLTGLSLGGFGAWSLAAKHGNYFAAANPICGGGNLTDAPLLAKVPLWAFHGQQDKAVLVEESRRMVRAIQAIGGTLSYTEFADVGHNAWDPAYSHGPLAEWLFAQSLKVPR